MEKAIDTFPYLLAVALFSLLLLSLFSGTYQVDQPDKFQVIEEFSLGTIGESQDFPAKTFNVGDVIVGKTQDEQLKHVILMDISQGMLGGETEKFMIQVPQAFQEIKRGVKITFTVVDANPIGNLKIIWNGKEFFSARPSGVTEFTIPKDYVKNENNVEVRSDGPGLFFWSATRYEIRDFKIFLQYGPQKVVGFDMLPSEIQNFDRGEVSFFGSGSGILQISVNSQPIFQATPVGSKRVEFNLSGILLNPGSNVLSFSSTASNTLSGTIFRIFLIKSEQVKRRTITLTKEDLTAIQARRGRMDITVKDIIRSGILKVTINGKQIDFPSIQEGENTVFFASTDVQEGNNVLEFTGSGSWDIPTVKVGFER